MTNHGKSIGRIVMLLQDFSQIYNLRATKLYLIYVGSLEFKVPGPRLSLFLFG
jgi:hypothetical protein